jgi:MFS family permease
MTTFTIALAALGVYAVGKTFFWPTMLAVVGDRFPQTGAVAMSIMGGIGMLSAGLIGGPGLGYCKDRFAGETLRASDAAVYEAYRSEKPSRFLNLPASEIFGLDGQKVAAARKAGADATEDQKVALAADQQGDRDTLKADSFIPATMAGIYLLFLLYFASIGGYRRVEMKS